MIIINNGKIFINGELTTNPELIGFALLDYAETIENDGLAIELKDSDVFINNVGKCVYTDIN
jgi:hypothetical protein